MEYTVDRHNYIGKFSPTRSETKVHFSEFFVGKSKQMLTYPKFEEMITNTSFKVLVKIYQYGPKVEDVAVGYCEQEIGTANLKPDL